MDRVTSSLIKDFLESYKIVPTNDSVNFEKFSSYSVISHEYSETFDINDIVVGENPGIDGIAIIVNGCLVTSRDEVDDLKDTNKYLEVKFIFTQSKTSDNFEGADIGTFGHSILDCFERKPRLTHNDLVLQKIEIISHIYDLSASMTRGLPVCKFYFITTGKWTNDTNLKSRFDTIVQDLKSKDLFQAVNGIPVGANEIQQLYLDTKRSLSTEIDFQHRALMPQPMVGIKECYIGIIPSLEFNKIITDDQNNLLPIFYDNIRAFQGDNEVNIDIGKTLISDKVDKFAVLNNGITIVAKGLTVAGNKFTIRDYQIVNGCQTSHVIYNNRITANYEKIWIPIKIIISEDDETVNDIIKATNHQTPIKAEELAALSQFQKDLEEYYKTYSGDSQLFYERRSKQYANQAGISKARIVTIPLQIKAFAAMFLELPHKVSRYYGTIVKEIGSDIFSQDHKFISYYTSAFAYYMLENCFRSGDVGAQYKKCRYHLLLAFRILAMRSAVPRLNSKEMDKYCGIMLGLLGQDTKSTALFKKASKVIDELGIDLSDRDNFKKQPVTELIKRKARSSK